MEGLEFVIDSRENKIKEIFSEMFQNKDDITEENVILSKFIKYEQLELGDIIIRRNNEPIIIFERKTITDLYNSIVNDNRYRSQKQRLKTQFQKENIHFIIEEQPHNNLDLYFYKNVMTAYITLSIKDKFQVHKTKDINDTVELLLQIFKRFIDRPDKYSSIEDDENVYSSKKIKHKGNLSQTNYMNLVLQSIPSISQTTANIICQEFKTIQNFNNHINNIEEEQQKLKYLSDFNINGKRLGIKKAQNILHYQFGISLEDLQQLQTLIKKENKTKLKTVKTVKNSDDQND